MRRHVRSHFQNDLGVPRERHRARPGTALSSRIRWSLTPWTTGSTRSSSSSSAEITWFPLASSARSRWLTT